jgi:hypothetical protein
LGAYGPDPTLRCFATAKIKGSNVWRLEHNNQMFGGTPLPRVLEQRVSDGNERSVTRGRNSQTTAYLLKPQSRLYRCAAAGSGSKCF